MIRVMNRILRTLREMIPVADFPLSLGFRRDLRQGSGFKVLRTDFTWKDWGTKFRESFDCVGKTQAATRNLIKNLSALCGPN